VVSTPPGLRFLRGLGRGLPVPPSPEGVGGQGARPASAVRRLQSGRAIPPAQHPKMPCSRRSSRRAGASSLPEGGDEPDAWSGWRFPGALLRRPDAPHLAVLRPLASASTPGIVDSSLSSHPVVQEALRRRSSPTRTGREGPPQAVVHEESCRTPLMGGLKDCPSIDIGVHVHSQLAAVLDRTRCPPR
jgi:hypothetical protein